MKRAAALPQLLLLLRHPHSHHPHSHHRSRTQSLQKTLSMVHKVRTRRKLLPPLLLRASHLPPRLPQLQLQLQRPFQLVLQLAVPLPNLLLPTRISAMYMYGAV